MSSRYGYTMIGAASVALCMTLLPLAEQGCSRAASPADVEAGGAVVNATCTLLEGVTQNQTLITICATVEEIALIASLVAPIAMRLATRPDACAPLAKTGVCLTPSELGAKIQVLIDRRRALLQDAAQ